MFCDLKWSETTTSWPIRNCSSSLRPATSFTLFHSSYTAYIRAHTYRFRYRNIERDRYNDSATKLPVLRWKRVSLITGGAVRGSFSNVDTHRRSTSYFRIIWEIDSREKKGSTCLMSNLLDNWKTLFVSHSTISLYANIWKKGNEVPGGLFDLSVNKGMENFCLWKQRQIMFLKKKYSSNDAPVSYLKL